MVTELIHTFNELEIENALAIEPENINEAIRQWRTLKDHVDEVTSTVNDHSAKMIYLKGYIQSNLTIEEDEDKSEVISIKGAGTASKKEQVAVQVLDWSAWRKYLLRNGYESVNYNQNTLAPLQDLYNDIMAGELPMPKSVNFKTIEKLSLRKA